MIIKTIATQIKNFPNKGLGGSVNHFDSNLQTNFIEPAFEHVGV